MIKITSPDTHDALVAGGYPLSSLISDHSIKSASAAFMREKIAEFKPDDRHFMQHLIAMGAHERYGWNRNGDTFTRDELMKTHPSFTKHAHLYREHRNSDPATLGIGFVKASAYNPEMDWVELLVWGDKRKAEKEYEMAKAGKELSYSMSCKIAGDICSCCDKFSRRTTDYCDHAANHLGQYLPEFKKYAFVYNPAPRFFDISIVGKPADRLAHYISYQFPGDMDKAASAEQRVIGGAAWAGFYGMSDEASILPIIARMHDDNCEFAKLAHVTGMNCFSSDAQLSQRQVDKLRSRNLPTVFRALAKRAALLPFDAFVAVVSGQPIDTIARSEDYKAALGALHAGQLKEACCAMSDIESQVSAGTSTDDADPIDEVIDEADGRLSCKIENSKPAVKVITVKVASPEASAWAAAYGVYKAAAARDMLDAGSINDNDVQAIALRF